MGHPGPGGAPHMSQVVVEVRDLKKHYQDTKAVDGVSFEIRSGEVFSLLGPNGAGKTTTVEILEGLRNPTSGEASVLGADVQRDYDRVRDRVGVTMQFVEAAHESLPRYEFKTRRWTDQRKAGRQVEHYLAR